MTQSTLIQFVDSRQGECSASVGTVEENVAVVLRLGENPEVSIRLAGSTAVQLARAILSAAGAKAALPQSRQIGGIIGPY